MPTPDDPIRTPDDPVFTPRPFEDQWSDIQDKYDDLRIGPLEMPDGTPNIWGQSQSPYGSPYSAHHYTPPNYLAIGNITGLGHELQDIIRTGQRQGQALLQRVDEYGDLPGQLESWREEFEADIAPDRTRLTEAEALIQQFGARLGDIEQFLGPGDSTGPDTGGVPSLQDQIDSIMGDIGGTRSTLTDLIDQYSTSTSAQLQSLISRQASDKEQILEQQLSDKEQILEQQQNLKDYVGGPAPDAGIGGMVRRPDGSWQTGHDAVNPSGLQQQLNDRFLTKQSFEDQMAGNLGELQKLLSDEWGEDIRQLDIGSIREAIAGVGGDLTRLSRDFSGADDEVRTQIEGLGGSLGDVMNRLGEYRESTSDLETDITRQFGEAATARAALGGNISERFGQQDVARELLRSDVAEQFGAQTSARERLRGEIGEQFGQQDVARELLRGDFTQQFSDIADQYGEEFSQAAQARQDQRTESAQARQALRSDVDIARERLTSDINRQFGESATAREALRGESATARERLTGDINRRFSEQETARQQLGSSLSQQWADRLNEQDRQFRDRMTSARSEYDKRLSDLSSNMNYRLIDDNTLGIKSRRSKAFRSGATRSGTGQLGRVDKINTLNIA